jgi:hypothetical protein
MKHFKDYALIILTAFVAVFCYRSCNGIKDIQVVESVVHDTITQIKVTSRWVKGNSIPYVIIATDTVHDSVQYTVHDTVRIMTDYMRTYAYSDTINVDSNTFVINDTISQNKIQSRGFEAKITEKTILTTITKAAKAKNTLYLGFRGDLSGSNGLEVLSPGLMLNAKNKALIGLNVNINKNFNIGYSGSIYFKIGKK